MQRSDSQNVAISASQQNITSATSGIIPKKKLFKSYDALTTSLQNCLNAVTSFSDKKNELALKAFVTLLGGIWEGFLEDIFEETVLELTKGWPPNKAEQEKKLSEFAEQFQKVYNYFEIELNL